MFCKYCGSQIDDDSHFCSVCGNRLFSSDVNDLDASLNIVGNIKTSVTYTNSAFAGVKKMIKDHVLGVIVYCIWFFLNLIFLFGGHGYTHFWPYIYVENVYRPYHVNPLIHDITHMTIDWNLRYYGINEFIIYVFIIPLIICFIYLKRNPILSFLGINDRKTGKRKITFKEILPNYGPPTSIVGFIGQIFLAIILGAILLAIIFLFCMFIYQIR